MTGAGRDWMRPALALIAAGWAANQFVPMIVAYRAASGVSASESSAIYGLYALGLVPALLIGGKLSDRVGRRAVVAPALLITALASVVLTAGGDHTGWLFVGRVLTGIGSGLVFSAAVAWVRELSLDAGPAAGARRATVAITVGFAVGPLVAGSIAQWLPLPLVAAYVPHVVLAVIAAIAVRLAPARVPSPAAVPAPAAGSAASTRPAGRSELGPVFRTFFAPFAPWVFGGAAVSLAYLIPLVAPRVGDLALLYCALVAAVGAAAGIVAQPLARALHRPGSPRLVIGAMSLVVLGLAGGAGAVAVQSPLLVALDAVVLGLSYGVCQFTGLLTVQRVADPAKLGVTVAGFQVLSYVGFAFPLLMALVEERWSVSPAVVVLALTALALACGVVASSARAARG